MRNRVATLLQAAVFMFALISVPAAHALELYGGAGTATTYYGACNNATNNPSFSGTATTQGPGIRYSRDSS